MRHCAEILPPMDNFSLRHSQLPTSATNDSPRPLLLTRKLYTVGGDCI
jgi:hypothetical protein